MSFIYQSGEIISDSHTGKANRYMILEKLGQGGTAITYSAKDLQTQEQVAIKVLSLQQLNDWKKIELFEREAKILQQLNHPAIPKYLDYFHLETEDDNLFYIVQQLAPGKSLASLIEEGWQPDEATVKEIAKQILEIIIYLQQLFPPVIHRDIKPQNLIFNPVDWVETVKPNNTKDNLSGELNKIETQGKKEIFLVDFGAVQDTYHHTVMGSTVVGTFGYMAPEQFRGQAFLATDLYGLGATLLFLLTCQSPAELPQHKLKLDFSNTVKISSEFANWINKLIEPNHQDRFPSAEAALAVLEGEESLSNYIRRKPPIYTSVRLTKTEEKLVITIPPAIFYQKCDRSLVFYTIAWHAALILIIFGISASWSFSVLNIVFLVYAYCLITEVIWAFVSNICLKITHKIQSFLLLLGFFILVAYFIFSMGNFAKLPSVMLISYLFLFVDRFLVSDTRSSLIRNLFCTTYLNIYHKSIKPYSRMKSLKIQRKLDGFKMSDINSSDDFKISPSVSSSLALSLFNQNNKRTEEYQFGGLLTKAEKLWLLEEIETMQKTHLKDKLG